MTDTVGTEADAAERDAYFVGGGIASLAGAAFLLRDTEIPGENVHVLEKRQVFGGALDGRGTPEEGYVLPGGRMFNFPTYECTWNLFRSIPSLEDPDTTIKGEMDEFNEKHETYAEARLVGADQEILDVSSYGSRRNTVYRCSASFSLPRRGSVRHASRSGSTRPSSTPRFGICGRRRSPSSRGTARRRCAGTCSGSHGNFPDSTR